jgi:putative MFS transporter
MKLRVFAMPADLSREDRGLLLLLAAAFFIGQYDMTLLSIALPDVQASFNIAEDDLGLLIAVGRLGAIPAILLALVADRIGRRKLMVFTMVGLSVFSLATAFATNATQFMLFQACARLFTTLEEILAVVFALEMLPKLYRGWGVGFIAAMGALGSGLAAVLYGGVEYLPGGWRFLYALAGVAILYVAWLRRKLPESPMFNPEDAGLRGAFFRPLQELLQHYRRPLFTLLAIACAFWFQVGAALNFMSKYLQDTHAYTPGQVSTLYVVAGTFAIFGNVLAGRLSDAIGRRPTLALGICLNCAGTVLFYNVLGPLIPVMWIATLFGFFMVEVVVNAISGELFPTTCRSTAATLRTISGVVAGAIGLAVEGMLFNLLGSHSMALSLITLSSLLALPVILLFLNETSNTQLE